MKGRPELRASYALRIFKGRKLRSDRPFRPHTDVSDKTIAAIAALCFQRDSGVSMMGILVKSRTRLRRPEFVFFEGIAASNKRAGTRGPARFSFAVKTFRHRKVCPLQVHSRIGWRPRAAL